MDDCFRLGTVGRARPLSDRGRRYLTSGDARVARPRLAGSRQSVPCMEMQPHHACKRLQLLGFPLLRKWGAPEKIPPQQRSWRSFDRGRISDACREDPDRPRGFPLLTINPLVVTDTKYTTLVRVLDRLCDEAPAEWRSYHPDTDDAAAVNRARSRAYLHLFLKVRFGLLTFGEREAFVTEGSQDGGVDAFFIDSETRTIYFIQSKFRTSASNFENKSIELEELLQMDIDRILDGEMRDLRGVEYNSRIKALIASIRSLDNISRYRYEVVLLANVKHVARQKIHQLTGGFPAQIYDYERCYSELLFPLVAATYYTFDDLHLSLNLSNKNAGSKISYSVNTEVAKLEITVVFVPTFEIAAAMNKYRNAILKYNPRSYLEHEGGAVNAAIKDSITKRTTNEFALFNNGITVLSDDTFLNERIGQKDRAQLTLVNPQIINGGQTAYTLSQVFRELPEQDRQRVFGEKEVLLKIITFDSDPKLEEGQKLKLIDDISRATNSQTVVSKADRRSNE